MRHAKATDANHSAIRDALRRMWGASVRDVSGCTGLGCDLLVTLRGRDTYFIEVKDGRKAPSARRLTESEEALRRQVGNAYVVLVSKEEALEWFTGRLRQMAIVESAHCRLP